MFFVFARMLRETGRPLNASYGGGAYHPDEASPRGTGVFMHQVGYRLNDVSAKCCSRAPLGLDPEEQAAAG